MTTEEMLQKIAELESENEALKKKLTHRPWRPTLPESLEAKYHELYQSNWGPSWMRMKIVDHEDLNTLSRIVRKACFDPVEKLVKEKDGKTHKSNYAISMLNLTEEQHTKYLDVMEKILDVLWENKRDRRATDL